MRHVLIGTALALISGCAARSRCEEGQIRQGDRCVPYEPGEPVAVPDEVEPLRPGATWQWQLTVPVDTSLDVDVYDVDLFEVSDEALAQLESDGRIVICYFSAGSYEPYRPDSDQFPEEAIGNKLEGWPDERWVDHTHPVVRDLMLARLDLAVERGCDGVEPDNVSAWSEDNGFGLNRTEQLEYNRFLADAAHERGLGIALKNEVEQLRELVDWFDYTVNEECAFYEECHRTQPFLDADKAVLHAEYVDRWADAQQRADDVCGVQPGLSTIVKTWDLGPERLACE